MIKLRNIGAALILLLVTMTATLATVPSYNGFTSRSSGYIVTATEWNYEWTALINFINTTIVAPLNSLSIGKGNLLVGDGTNVQTLTNAGSADNGKCLTLDNTQAYGAKWAALVSGVTALTTKGDTLVYDTNLNRLPVGADGTVLQADSTQTAGVKWGTGIPSGSIVMWYGSVASIPSGWYLCNGQTTPSSLVTPNLQGMFVCGAGSNSPASGGFGILAPNTTGGSTAHSHSVTVSSNVFQAGTGAYTGGALGNTYITSSTSTAPAYTALCFIMKG